MKKLSISDDKIIKDKELVNLKGGGSSWFHCECRSSDGTVYFEDDVLLYNDPAYTDRWLDTVCWESQREFSDCYPIG